MDNDCKKIAANALSRKSTGGSGKDKQAPKSPLQMPMVVAAAKKARTKVKSGTATGNTELSPKEGQSCIEPSHPASSLIAVAVAVVNQESINKPQKLPTTEPSKEDSYHAGARDRLIYD